MSYLYLKKDESNYKIRTLVSLFHVMIIAWWLVGIAIVVYSEYLKTGIVIITFTSSILILMLMKSSKTRIIPSEKIIKIDTRVWRKDPIQYSFLDFHGFELQTVYYLRIPVNSELHGLFISVNGNINRHLLGESLGKRSMQLLCNELEEFLKPKISNTGDFIRQKNQQ